LAVAEAFEQEGHNEAVLVRQHGDGATQGVEALAVFQALMSAGRWIDDFRQGFVLPPFPAVEERRIDGDAVEPGADLRLAAEVGERVPDVAHDFLKEIFHFAGPVEPGETEALDGRFVPLEEILKHALALGVIHGVKPIRYSLAEFLTSGDEK